MDNQINDMPQAPEQVQVVDIQFRPGQKVYFFDPAGHNLKAGDHVIIDTARGPEYGTCTAGNHTVSAKDIVAPLRPVIRIANEQDEKTAAENQAKEKKAYDFCMKEIAAQKLDMQLVSAECAFDGSRILFFFTADERVDFRELVKTLASTFHTRIELRQIGVRDKAKMVGGLGICGRPFCCASFLDDFQPVSIKMAKTQNLSLNPTKISGTCGRLMCCLKYENDAYQELLRTTPPNESLVDTPQGRGTIIDTSLLKGCCKVRLQNNPDTPVTFRCDECTVLRAGREKGPRQQEPKQPKAEKPVELPVSEALMDTLEPVEPQAQPEMPASEDKPRQQQRRRRDRNKKPAGEQKPAAQGAQTPAAEKPAAPSGEQKAQSESKPQGEGEQRPRHNRNRHRRRHHNNGDKAAKSE